MVRVKTTDTTVPVEVLRKAKIHTWQVPTEDLSNELRGYMLAKIGLLSTDPLPEGCKFEAWFHETQGTTLAIKFAVTIPES